MGFFAASEIEVDDVQRDYAAMLIPGEQVLAAFRTVRDIAFLTNYRFALVDVQGLTGRKVDILSIPYRSITRYSVETAGTFDMDAELRVWVSGDPEPIEVKVGRRSNVANIQQILARAVLGPR
jgi:hypothetical protein